LNTLMRALWPGRSWSASLRKRPEFAGAMSLGVGLALRLDQRIKLARIGDECTNPFRKLFAGHRVFV